MKDVKELGALGEPPGSLLVWMIVALELCTFGMVFLVLAHLRAAQPQVFAEGQAALTPAFGLGLTLLLLSSGALAAQAVDRARAGAPAAARRRFQAAIALGLGFVALKLWDFGHLVAAGHRLGASDFWDAYFLSTGFHLLHVVVGLALLGVASRVGKARFEDEETAVAGPALFWHMCDVAWLVLFPLLFAR